MSLEALMWVEKYRPHKIDDIVNQEEVKERLRPLLDKKAELPHMLFAGPPGSGKTTAAMILSREILGPLAADYTLSLNASDERGIDIVRERIKTFASYSDRREGVPFRLVVLDEADEMTRDAQTALRRIMEETSRYTRFILICNYSSNLIEPIQSRCAIFRFKKIGQDEVVACLKKVAKSEEVKASAEVLKEVAFAVDGDLRQAINLLQAASGSGSSEVTLAKVQAATGSNAKEKSVEVVRLAMGGDFAGARLKLVELTRVYGIPESDFLRFANEEIVKNGGPRSAEAIGILAEFDYRLAMGSNPEVQLTALLAALAALADGKKAP
ncbi:MAG: replication factor C small subunit [Thaumarchaeota archaeon]|nr:replication factor C small subunit [Nitrososphaerota archaeon]